MHNPRIKPLGYDPYVKYFGHIDYKVIMSKHDYEANRERLLKLMNENDEFLLKLIEKSFECFDRNTKFWKKVYNIKNLNKLSNDELADIFHEYIELISEYGAYIMVPLYIEFDLSDFIRKKLEEHKVDVDKYYTIIMNPVKEGQILREKESFLKMALKFKNGKDIEEDLKKHIEEFSWMPNSCYTETYHTRDYYINRIKETSKKDVKELIYAFEEEQAEKKKKYQEVLEKFQDDKKLITLIKTAQENIFYRSFRSERLYQSPLYLGNLFREMAKRLGLEDYRDILWLISPEIIKLLRNNEKADKKMIDERKTGFAFITSVTDGRCASGKELVELRKEVIFDEVSKEEVKGNPTYKGKVKGRVCLVLSMEDLKKLKKGDVLVTDTTTPNYVPFLHKVSAIVTDEGGITCHAAVISREMKIPCIIGTHNASKALKDGDMVEVDADNGVVRKLS